ncbi:hypothetical protein K2X40_02155 [Candidatus Babeliales bacterium]|nr:hypothetical protein [Candidatus Babeliales bacterium]MBY0352822.1 hypothetical protein [Candidatus Babeliales bacterium]
MNLPNQKKSPFLIVLIGSIIFINQYCLSLPMLNVQDPAIIHTIMGTDKYYKERKNGELNLHISPFYQHTASASQAGSGNKTGNRNKVATGNMLGRWNMFALFYNDARPTGVTTPTLQAARVVVNGLTGQNSGYANSTISTPPTVLFKNFTLEQNFDLENGQIDEIGTYNEVHIEYEKLGLRGRFGYDFAFGLGIAIKAGVAAYKQVPAFALDSIIDDTLKNTPPPTESGASPVITIDQTFAKDLFDKLLSKSSMLLIAKELGLNLCEQRRTEPEDMHVSVYWTAPIKIKGADDNIFTVAPHISVGVWLPFGQEIDANQPFTISTGNDGFTGGTVEATISCDFPEMMQVSFGGGVAFYGSKELTGQRVPTSIYQVGIIPWTTTINRKPGAVWYVNASLKADNFVKDFSFYCDYVYTEHARDSIRVIEANATRKAKFLPGELEKRSAWKIQNFNASLEYAMNQYCSLGVGVQGTIEGVRTYRPTTLLGSFIARF